MTTVTDSDEQIKAFHRKFVTGVTIVTTNEGDRPRGLAVNAFASVTLSPAMILVCVAKSSSTHDVLFGAERFAVSLLAHNQREIAQRFATKSADKFSGLAWHRGEFGNPIIDGVCAYLEAETSSRVRTSTHTVFFGTVLATESREDAPLIYAGGQFYDGRVLDKLRP